MDELTKAFAQYVAPKDIGRIQARILDQSKVPEVEAKLRLLGFTSDDSKAFKCCSPHGDSILWKSDKSTWCIDFWSLTNKYV